MESVYYFKSKIINKGLLYNLKKTYTFKVYTIINFKGLMNENFKFCLIDMQFNPKIAYYLESMRREIDKRVGHILSLSFPKSNLALKPDTLICNPLGSPSDRVAVVGIMDSIRWEGDTNSVIELYGRISFQNKAILQEVFMSDEDPIIEIS